MGFDTQDLLKQGRYNEGDVVVGPTLNSYVRSDSFTTTSFSSDRGVFESFISFGDLFPDGATIVGKFNGRVVAGSGETVDIRVRNAGQSETIVELTGITSDPRITTGFVEYDPSSPGSVGAIDIQRRTNPGSNSSQILSGQVTFGVKL